MIAVAVVLTWLRWGEIGVFLLLFGLAVTSPAWIYAIVVTIRVHRWYRARRPKPPRWWKVQLRHLRYMQGQSSEAPRQPRNVTPGPIQRLLRPRSRRL